MGISGQIWHISEIFWKQIRLVQVGQAHFMSEILCHSGTHLDTLMIYIFAIGAALDTSAYIYGGDLAVSEHIKFN